MSPLERVMGIEPTQSAWKAEVLPLNYTRAPLRLWILPHARAFVHRTGRFRPWRLDSVPRRTLNFILHIVFAGAFNILDIGTRRED